MNPRVRAVMRKEFMEYRRNKLVVITMAILPVVFLVLPTVTSLAVPASASEQAVRGVVGNALLLLFLVPMILPTTVAAYSVVGEREQGTLEPVLTTPVTDSDLMLGKALAATVPAVLIGWTLFAVYAMLIRALAAQVVVDRIWQPSQFAGELLFAPVFALFAIWVGMAISVRSTDVRVAQQLSGLVILPVIGLSALISFNVVKPSIGLYAGIALVLAGIDAVGYRFTARLFDRERLLTRFGGSAT